MTNFIHYIIQFILPTVIHIYIFFNYLSCISFLVWRDWLAFHNKERQDFMNSLSTDEILITDA